MKMPDLNLGDMEDFENIAGVPFTSVADLDTATMGAKTMIAFAYIIRRKTDPNTTLDQVRSLTLSELNALMEVGEDVSPE